MKIIELLNKIVNKEKMPQKIKYKEIIYYYSGGDESGNCYFTCPKGCGGDWLHFEVADLNDEVEIIEEQDDNEIEHYDLFDNFIGFSYNNTDKNLLDDLTRNFYHINNELKCLVEEINKLKEDK